MQFPQKLLNQISEDGKKANFRPDFGLFDPNLGCQIFFVDFTSASIYILFQAIILCNLKENLLTKLAKMAKNLILGPTAAQIWTPNFFFVSFTCTRFKTLLQDTIVWNFKETNEPNLKMAKKT